jgi:thiamine biosynthesis protein ThiS
MKCTIAGKTVEMDFEGTAFELLGHLKLGRESVIVKVNGTIIPETEHIGNADNVEIMRVIYGG